MAGAAYEALSHIYPDQQPALARPGLDESLKQVKDGPAEAGGLSVRQVRRRPGPRAGATDGSDAMVQYMPQSGPGKWRPDPLNPGQVAWGPGQGDVTPFAMTSGDQFAPPPPPALTSKQYTDAFNEVKSLGAKDSTTRTPDQTQMGLFWALRPPGMGSPLVMYDQALCVVAQRAHNSLVQNARLFALAGIAMGDAGIAAWNVKFADNFWRPVAAIREADTDGNPATDRRPELDPARRPRRRRRPRLHPAVPLLRLRPRHLRRRRLPHPRRLLRHRPLPLHPEERRTARRHPLLPLLQPGRRRKRPQPHLPRHPLELRRRPGPQARRLRRGLRLPARAAAKDAPVGPAVPAADDSSPVGPALPARIRATSVGAGTCPGLAACQTRGPGRSKPRPCPLSRSMVLALPAGTAGPTAGRVSRQPTSDHPSPGGPSHPPGLCERPGPVRAGSGGSRRCRRPHQGGIQADFDRIGDRRPPPDRPAVSVSFSEPSDASVPGSGIATSLPALPPSAGAESHVPRFRPASSTLGEQELPQLGFDLGTPGPPGVGDQLRRDRHHRHRGQPDQLATAATVAKGATVPPLVHLD